jgi:hypothetical protein
MKSNSNCDLLKDYISPINLVPCWWTSIIPIYLLFVNTQTASNANRIIEHCAAIYVLILMVNTVKRSINPCSDLNSIDYYLPAIVLLNLTVCFYSLVPPQYIPGYIISIISLTMYLRLNDSSNNITTGAMINDIVLSTLLFIIYKKDLRFGIA